MKFLNFILALLVSQTLFGQAFFTPDKKHKSHTELSKHLSSYEVYSLDEKSMLQTLSLEDNVSFDLEIEGVQRKFAVNKTNFLSEDYKLYSSTEEITTTKGGYAFYTGEELTAGSNTKVSIMLVGNKVKLNVHDNKGSFSISQNKKGQYVGYYDHQLKAPLQNEWACEIAETKEKIDKQYAQKSNAAGCVTLFIEVDHNMYNKKSSSIPATEAWMLDIMSQVVILFMEHEIPFNVSGIQVWDTPDPYIGATNTSEALNLFRNAVRNNPNNNGRLAHLVSGRGLGGGIAYLNSLCSNSTNVAVSANMKSGTVSYPNYSWNVMVVAHEIGHNMGSNHTHACVWNGNNTAIDGCGEVTNCDDPPHPAGGGTVMSYCHLIGGVGINLAKGFGPQPGALIYDRYSEANCVTGENCAPVSPFNDVCTRALDVPIHGYCIPGTYKLIAPTASSAAPFDCGSPETNKDVWLTFSYNSSASMNIELQGLNGLNDLVMQVYKGDCNSLTSISCQQTNAAGAVNLTLDNSHSANEIYIRIAELDSDMEGEFELCVYDSTLPCDEMVNVLNDFYAESGGSSWTNNSGWANGATSSACDICNWHGVTCNKYGEIIELDLSSNNVTGNLSEKIFDFQDLVDLNLSQNLITKLPSDIWDTLRVLKTMDLSYNQISDTIPRQLRYMAKLKTVNFDNNAFYGPLPEGLGYNSSWRSFTARNNLLIGCFSIGISSFCYKDLIDLSGNAGLPYNGDVTLLCSQGYGSDNDKDGFCREIEDCNDFDNSINPDADEIPCDGKDNNCNDLIDEGTNHGPNVWTGAAGNMEYQDAANWSLNHVPLICEDVEVGTGGETINMLLKGEQGIEGNIESIKIRNLYIGPNTELTLDTSQLLFIASEGQIVNEGTLRLIGSADFDYNIKTDTCFINKGHLDIRPNGSIYMGTIGDVGFFNETSGTINVEGYFNVSNYQMPFPQWAIINQGTIEVKNSIYIQGDFEAGKMWNKGNGALIIYQNGNYYIY